MTAMPFGTAELAASTGRQESTHLVGLLIWVYQRQKADVMTGRSLWSPELAAEAAKLGRPIRQVSRCGCARIGEIGLLGTQIDGGGWQRPALHPDAELVHDRLVELSRKDWIGALLLQRYGRQGGVPEWDGGRQEFEPVRDQRDRIIQNRCAEVVMFRDGRGRLIEASVPYCPVQPYPSDEWLALLRGEYAHWFTALQSLAADLSGRVLTRWQMIGLGAEATPWTRNDEAQAFLAVNFAVKNKKLRNK